MTRIDIARTNKLGYAAVIGMETYARTHVEAELYELIKLRASIVNGCGFCVDMHASAGLKRGYSPRKLHAVAAWQHAGELFDDRERAALALTDAVTNLSPDSVTDEIWAAAAAHFSDDQLGSLVLAIATINVWNRVAIATEMTPPMEKQ